MPETGQAINTQRLAADIARELSGATGEVWKPAPGTQLDNSDARLDGPDNLRVHLATDRYRQDGRIVIGGSFQDLYDYTPQRRRGLKDITVSQAKSPQQIARDIMRRVLPEYRDIMSETLQRKASHEADMSARSARKVGIVAAHGGKHYDCGQHAGSLGSIGGRTQADYKVRADDVEFTITIAADLAVKFAEYLGTLN